MHNMLKIGSKQGLPSNANLEAKVSYGKAMWFVSF